MSRAELEPVAGQDARDVPVRLLVVQEDERPAVEQREEETVMTFPHLAVRELIAFVVLSIVLVGVALLFDAPLEELANPEKTPNPSKAPWYFLGLQELLHYYPPLISGVILPSAVIASLIVVPYFQINLQRQAMWEMSRPAKLLTISGVTAGICVVFYVSAAHPVWSLIGVTIVIGVLMMLPGIFGRSGPVLGWLASRSIAFWVFTWFLLAAVVLTVIGTFFRGPGWELTLPWRDGIY